MNPLQRMLGTYLRLERVRLGYSTGDVARRLGLTDTYFRLVEAGRAALNQSLIFRVIQVFAGATVQTHKPRTIGFNRFSLYLVGMHWVGAELALEGDAPPSPRCAVEKLASFVGEFQFFYEQVKAFFDLEEGSPEQRSFLEEVAAQEVGDFLCSEIYGGGSDASRDFLRLGELPTLNIDILLDLKQSLSGRSFVHTAEIAAKWEEENVHQFRYVRGVYRKAETIVSLENLSQFHFSYLLQRRFLGVQMIFLEASIDAEGLKELFVKYLNAGRARSRDLAPVTPLEAQKIQFLCLSESQAEEFMRDPGNLLKRGSQLHEAYWSFETHLGLHISFVGLLNNNPESTRNLTLNEADKKANQFVKLWKNFEDASKVQSGYVSGGPDSSSRDRSGVRRNQSAQRKN